MHNPSELADVFTTAARHINRIGHCKGGFHAPDIDAYGRPRYASTPHQDRPADLIGAIRIAGAGHPMETNTLVDDAIAFASARLHRRPPVTDGENDLIEHLAYWNDRPERTAADVAMFLHRLAVEAMTPQRHLVVAA